MFANHNQQQYEEEYAISCFNALKENAIIIGKMHYKLTSRKQAIHLKKVNGNFSFHFFVRNKNFFKEIHDV